MNSIEIKQSKFWDTVDRIASRILWMAGLIGTISSSFFGLVIPEKIVATVAFVALMLSAGRRLRFGS